MRAFPRGLTAALAAILIALLAGGAWFYNAEKRRLEDEAEKKLSAITEMKANQIAAWRTERLADAAVMMARPFFLERVEHWMKNQQDQETAKDILENFQSLKQNYHYHDLLLTTPDGTVLLSLIGSHEKVHQEAMTTLAQALKTRRPALTDLYGDEISSAPHISVIAPLFEGKGQEAQPLGAVIIICDASQFLYPLVQFWPTPSQSAETLLVRREGDSVLFLNDLRHQPGAALKLRLPLSQKDLPAVMAVEGREGLVRGVYYRGGKVIAVLRPIPDSPWFMVSKVDEAEALAAWRSMSFLIAAIFIVLAASVSLGTGVFWQRRQKAQFQELYRTEAALRKMEKTHLATLMSVGDGVITVDRKARVELLNPVAEALTGWTQAEARGRPLMEVFRIVNEETGEAVEDPASRVMREGVVVGLANHTLLIAREGTERPIADSGAPIRDERGEIIGVVLVFRDQTEERAAERALRESEERYRRLFESAKDGILILDADTGAIIDVNPFLVNLLGFSREQFLGRKLWEIGLLKDLVANQDNFQQLQERQYVRYEDLPLKTADGRGIEVAFVSNVYLAGRRKVIQCNIRDITDRKRAEEEREKLQDQLLQAQKMESIGQLAGGIAHDFNNQLSVILAYAEMALKELEPDSPLYNDLREILNAGERSAALTRQLLAFARKQTVRPRIIEVNETLSGLLKMLSRLIGEDIELAFKPGREVWTVKMDPSQIDQILANLAVNARDAITGTGKLTIETENAEFDEPYCADHHGYVPGDYVMLAVSDNGCGMDEETRSRIFEPFFTTKGVGKGTGLGLPTVYGIVRQNEGFVNVYSEPGQGTTFRIYLPRYIARTEEAAAPQTRPAMKGGTETVLMVEDEASILKLGKRVLGELGYHVLTAHDSEEAVQLCQEHVGEIQLLITDVVMPKMNGRELAGRLALLKPGLKVLYMSGYTANVIAHHGVLEEGVHFLQKPFTVEELAARVREALDDGPSE